MDTLPSKVQERQKKRNSVARITDSSCISNALFLMDRGRVVLVSRRNDVYGHYISRKQKHEGQKTEMYDVSYCKVCLSYSQVTSLCPYMKNNPDFVHIRSLNFNALRIRGGFHSRVRGRKNSSLSTHHFKTALDRRQMEATGACGPKASRTTAEGGTWDSSPPLQLPAPVEEPTRTARFGKHHRGGL